jgi:hypothetical protein
MTKSQVIKAAKAANDPRRGMIERFPALEQFILKFNNEGTIHRAGGKFISEMNKSRYVKEKTRTLIREKLTAEKKAEEQMKKAKLAAELEKRARQESLAADVRYGFVQP